MLKYYLGRMEDAFNRGKMAAAEISVCGCKAPYEKMTDDELNQVNLYAQFAAELRELIGRYEADLAEFKTPGCFVRVAIDRVVNELVNGLTLKATMRPFRGGKGDA